MEQQYLLFKKKSEDNFLYRTWCHLFIIYFNTLILKIMESMVSNGDHVFIKKLYYVLGDLNLIKSKTMGNVLQLTIYM